MTATLTRPTAVVIAGPGTNRDRDVADALQLAGAAPRIALVDELIAGTDDSLDAADVVVVAGGFSYGDALGAGRMLAADVVNRDGGRLGAALRAVVDRGRPVIGICNGFQTLTHAGLLPGALGANDSGHFRCSWVALATDPASHCVWTADAPAVIDCPIAHGEGRYVHPDPEALAANGQIALRYADGNPNGSVDDIAGVCDRTGLVLGLMPHPENHIVARQLPHARRAAAAADGHGRLGLELFRSALTAIGGRR